MRRTRTFLPVVSLLSIFLSVALAQTPAAPAPEKKITQAEADELFRSVDELTLFASKTTGFEQRTPVKRELTSRELLEKFLQKKMDEDEETKRLERSEWVIKKFGLLPRDFQLRAFIVNLLRDQVAGFYDPERKTVYLLDWIAADVQRPVLAHELAHALQDQNFDLEKWLQQARKTAETHTKRFAEAEFDEAAGARSAVTEGQAMLVLLEYMLSQNGMTMQDAPEFVNAFAAAFESSSIGPLASSAPLLIRESLLFPYRDGVRFTFEVMRAKGRQRAFSGVFAQPPMSTREILDPAAYLANERLPTLELPDLKPAFRGNYEIYDVGSVGQFDVNVMARQFADTKIAASLSPHWRGGVYLAAVPKGKMSTRNTSDISIAFLSKWSSIEKAAEFARFYSDTLPRRFKNVTAAGDSWKTDEGEVTIEAVGEYVIALESFDPAVARQIRSACREQIRYPKTIKAGSVQRREMGLSIGSLLLKNGVLLLPALQIHP